MRHLNYSHLLYFWTVARQGSIAKASDTLHLTPQTISGQLRLLDEAVGERLFVRAGRRLVLSEMGQLVFQYADEIFALGGELAQVVRGKTPGLPLTFNVGIIDSIPKLITYRVIEPVLNLAEPLRLRCHESSLENLLSELAVHRLDMVLSDKPVPPGLNVRAYHHLLGSSGVTIFGNSILAKRYRRDFPSSLSGAPMLLPVHHQALRNQLDAWFEERNIVPLSAGEFDDSALMKVFGQAGVGLFAGPTAIEQEICKTYHVAVVGRLPDVQERFYAITPERKLKHPAIVSIMARAREAIFAGPELAMRESA
jgi:LysR family transcriptional activator of nhaA